MMQSLEIGDSSKQFHRSGDWSLMEIRSLDVTGSHTPTAQKSAQDFSLAFQAHRVLVIHDSYIDWRMDLLFRVDEMYKLEMSYCIDGIWQAIHVWELLHKSPKNNTMGLKSYFKYFEYDVLLNLKLFAYMINSMIIILLHRRDSEPILNEQNDETSLSNNNKGGIYSEKIKHTQMQYERVENELTLDDVNTYTLTKNRDAADCEMKSACQGQKYGTLRRSFTMQNLHSANQETIIKTTFPNQFQFPLEGEGKKASFRSKVCQILETPWPSRRSIKMSAHQIEQRENVHHNERPKRGNHYSSTQATEGEELISGECPKKFLAEFRVRNMEILTGKRVDNSANRCLCELATPLKCVQLRFHTIHEDGFLDDNEDGEMEGRSAESRGFARTEELPDLSVVDADGGVDGVGAVICRRRWWTRAARTVRRVLLGCFGCGGRSTID